MEFDLEIAIDAPVGRKRVIVTYDKGKKSVENSDVISRSQHHQGKF